MWCCACRVKAISFDRSWHWIIVNQLKQWYKRCILFLYNFVWTVLFAILFQYGDNNRLRSFQFWYLVEAKFPQPVVSVFMDVLGPYGLYVWCWQLAQLMCTQHTATLYTGLSEGYSLNPFHQPYETKNCFLKAFSHLSMCCVVCSTHELFGCVHILCR